MDGEDWEERDARLSVSLRRFVCLRSRVCVVMTDRGVVLVCVFVRRPEA